jgi:hypothetical protein
MAHGGLEALRHNGFGAPSIFCLRHDQRRTAQWRGASMAHVRCGTIWHGTGERLEGTSRAAKSQAQSRAWCYFSAE